ncbi:MAG: hypothetical protein K6A23_09220 [Butyrivibrio sp.]|nr:hypothetical protein [Butyrivibrio sp.]
MFKNSKFKREFLYKKSYLQRRLQTDVMENGVAYIPCKVKSIDDIISKFSVKGCESLDTEFLTYIIDYAEFVPPEYPVVLEIRGAKFTPEEKKIISDTVTADMDYILGRTVDFINIRRKRFVYMIIGTVLSGIFLFIAKKMFEGVPLEFFYVLFWLFADTFVRYLFIDKLDFKEEKIHMGRLASMTVEFIEQCD